MSGIGGLLDRCGFDAGIAGDFFGVPSTKRAPLTSTEMRLANENTMSMSCSINSTVTSLGKVGTAVEDLLLRLPARRRPARRAAARVDGRRSRPRSPIDVACHRAVSGARFMTSERWKRFNISTISITSRSGCRRRATSRGLVRAVRIPPGRWSPGALGRRTIG